MSAVLNSTRIRVYAFLWTAAFLIHFSWQSFDFAIACIRHDSPAANASLHASWSWLGPAFASWSLGTLTIDLPAGYFIDKFGVRYIFGAGLLIASGLNLLLPFAIDYLPVVCVIRFFSGGLTQGIRWSGQNSVAAKWAPVHELGLIMGIGSAFAAGGSMTANSLGAVLCTSTTVGWSGLFYIISGLMLCWSVLWIIFYRERPEWDSKVPRTESNHIIEHRNFKASQYSQRRIRRTTKKKIPWKSIALCGPLWAAGLCGFTNAWLTAFTVTFGPTFFQTTTTGSLLLNGLYASLPLLGNLITKLVCGLGSDQTLKCLSRTKSMKIFTCTSLGVVSIVLAIGAVVIQEGAKHNAAVLIISFTFQGALIAGAFKSPVLLAPAHAGILTGCMEIMSSVGAICSVNLISSLTTDSNMDSWRIVFGASSVIAATAAFVFLIFGSGETQSWNSSHWDTCQHHSSSAKEPTAEPDDDEKDGEADDDEADDETDEMIDEGMRKFDYERCNSVA